MDLQLEKADSRVNFRMAATGAPETCANCRFFEAMDMECSLVEGAIGPDCVCTLWTEQMAGMSAQPTAVMPPDESDMGWSEEGKPAPFQLFVAHKFATDDFSQPQWIPFLPTPGKYQHPTYGEINVTKGFNQALVDSVTSHIYQDNIPLDVEHETKLSGAVAWIKDMRLNEDGSADAFVEWTERGKQLLRGGQFKYVSPEWFGNWRDPASGVVHHNVVAGGAITTRPFFKEKVLRALVASETGAHIIKSNEEDISVPDKDPTPTPTPPTPPTPEVKAYTASEVDDKIKTALEAAATTFNEKISGMTTELEAAKTLAASEKTAREETAAALLSIQKDNRHARFVETVSGRGGAGDGAPWAGDADKHVEFLEKLADQFGGDSDVITNYMEQQKAIAAQLKESDAFRELGSSGRVVSDPEKQLDALAKARAKADPTGKMTEAQAYAEVMETAEGKKLYERSQQV